MKSILLFFAMALAFVASAFAKIIRVPADQPTIQAAINAAAKGDTVLVAEGAYFENIDFKGKAITVASHFLMDADTSHISKTIINGSRPSHPDSGSVVFFISGEDTTSVIYGFTITGGTGTLYGSDERIGGGIYYLNSGARIAHNKIVHNSLAHHQRSWGGGIGTQPWQHDKHQIIIEENVIEANTASGNERGGGGGVFLIQGKVSKNKIRFNSCSSVSLPSIGGGIFSHCDTIFHRALVVIVGNTITNNVVSSTNSDGRGGGVDIQKSNVHLLDNVISHNQVGGGFYNFGSGVRLTNGKGSSVVKGNTISFNSCVQGNCWGGGLHVYESAGLTIQGNRFEGNRSEAGGGIYCEKSNPAIIGNTFTQNHAPSGGGIFCWASAPLINNNLMAANKAQWGGAIVVGQDPSPTYVTRIINNTIITNVADRAGGIGLYNVEAMMLNTISWGNSALYAPEILVEGAKLHVAYSDIQSGQAGIQITENGWLNWLEANIEIAPRLVADSLSNDSPCIGAGAEVYDFGNSNVCQCPEKDINGRSRPYPAGTKPDLGAWESMRSTTGVEFQSTSEIPQIYALHQNHPNPFNPSTTIAFALSKASFVTLKIYNLLGNEVATLVAEKLPAGKHRRVWEAKGLASGVYLYRIEAGEFVQTKKLILGR